MTLDELTKMLFEADRPVELALEMKISDGNEHQIAECIVDWLQRWGWDPDSGTLGGATSQVSLSVMSFSLKALAVVETAVPAARLCPLFSTKNREALQIGKPSWHGPDQLLGPSVGWVSRYESVVKSWLAAGRTCESGRLKPSSSCAVSSASVSNRSPSMILRGHCNI